MPNIPENVLDYLRSLLPKCPRCNNTLQGLDPLFFHTGRAWYGCKGCNLVIAQHFCSFTGRKYSENICDYTYEDYQKAIKDK